MNPNPVTVYGLTGGIGMGKSTAAEILVRRGVVVVDTDQLARQLVVSGQPALVEIQREFGSKFITSDRQLDRSALARLVFTDAVARQKLEAILHPRIRKGWQAQVDTWRQEGRRAAVVVIPLLFETAAEAHFDKVLCLACSAATQHTRLRARGWSPEQIAQRISAQWPVEKKMNRADYVVWTEGSVAALAEQLERIVA